MSPFCRHHLTWLFRTDLVRYFSDWSWIIGPFNGSVYKSNWSLNLHNVNGNTEQSLLLTLKIRWPHLVHVRIHVHLLWLYTQTHVFTWFDKLYLEFGVYCEQYTYQCKQMEMSYLISLISTSPTKQLLILTTSKWLSKSVDIILITAENVLKNSSIICLCILSYLTQRQGHGLGSMAGAQMG